MRKQTEIAILYANCRTNFKDYTPPPLDVGPGLGKPLAVRSTSNEIQIPLHGHDAGRIAPDRAMPVTLNGSSASTDLVGACDVREDGTGVIRFSQSANGQKAMSGFVLGELEPFMAFRVYDRVRRPCAITLRKKQVTEMSQAHVDEILALGQKHNMPDMARVAVKKGRSLSEFRANLLDAIGEQPLGSPAIASSNQPNFSLGRVLRAQVTNDWSEAGYEKEVCQEARRNYAGTPNGIVIPHEHVFKRATMVSTGDIGGAIGTQLMPSAYIDIRRQASSVMAAGATVMTGLTQNVDIPKNNSDVAANFVAENSSLTDDDIDIDTVSLTPKLVGGTTSMSRQVLVQAQPMIDELVRDGLEKQIMNRIDATALEGSGSGAVPTGIKNTTGVNTKATAGSSTMTHAESAEVVAAIGAANIDAGSGAWIVHPNDGATLAATSKDSGSGTFVYENGTILGRRVIESTHASEGTAYYGVFSNFIIGFFGALDLVVDPYSNASTGRINITASQLVDMNVRHAQAFTVVTLTA